MADSEKLGELKDLIRTEAPKLGFSSKSAENAINMLNKGKINMSQIAPNVKSMLMNQLTDQCGNMCDNKTKLKNKINSQREMRQNKAMKNVSYQRTKQKMEDDKKKEELKKVQVAKRDRNRKNRKRKKLSELEKRLGTVSEEQYRECLRKTSFINDDDKNRTQNIIDLYHKQNRFSDKIENDIELDNFSDLSDLSD